jgi:DNA transformation protein
MVKDKDRVLDVGIGSLASASESSMLRSPARRLGVLASRPMSTSQSTIDFLLDQLTGLADVQARKMFGEYALYCGDKVVALVCDNQLFVKITPPGKALVGAGYQEGEAYPGAKPSLLIGADLIEDSERLCELMRATASALPPPKPKKAGKRGR